jgi:hypothetical protein
MTNTYRLLFSCPNGRQFAGVFRNEIGEDFYGSARVETTFREPPLVHYSIPSLELTVVENPETDGWSCYEWRSRALARDFRRRATEHTLGAWTRSVPKTPGTYATLDALGVPAEPRTLVIGALGLKDVTRGFVGAGKVSEWRGSWWSCPYAEPPAPDKE